MEEEEKKKTLRKFGDVIPDSNTVQFFRDDDIDNAFINTDPPKTIQVDKSWIVRDPVIEYNDDMLYVLSWLLYKHEIYIGDVLTKKDLQSACWKLQSQYQEGKPCRYRLTMNDRTKMVVMHAYLAYLQMRRMRKL